MRPRHRWTARPVRRRRVRPCRGGGGGGGGGGGAPCCTHTLPHEGMVYAVAMGEGYILGGTVGRVMVWRSRHAHNEG